LRNGWTGDEVKPGDHIKIIGNPSRDGSFVVHWQKLVLADGKELWGEDHSYGQRARAVAASHGLTRCALRQRSLR
jgi:hypothetical protein